MLVELINTTTRYGEKICWIFQPFALFTISFASFVSSLSIKYRPHINTHISIPDVTFVQCLGSEFQSKIRIVVKVIFCIYVNIHIVIF